MYLKQYILGEMLHLANSSPPWWRSEFYAIKDRILKQYGTFEAFHMQHIVKHCYACEGSGKRMIELLVFDDVVTLPSGNCRKCGGTGKYDEFWTVLRSYRLGRRRFHKPQGKYYRADCLPDLPIAKEIEGFITHRSPKFYLSSEAGYWLALIFDRKLFFQHWGRVGHSSRKFTPLVVLGTWIFNIKHFPHTLKSRVDRRQRIVAELMLKQKQLQCQHEFPWAEEPDAQDECKKCGIMRYVVYGPEVPF